MNLDFKPGWAWRCTLLSRVAGGFVLARATLVLGGWLFDLPILTSTMPGGKAMSSLSAFSFILAGVSLMLWTTPPGRRRLHQLAAALGAGVVLLGLFRITEFLSGAVWEANILIQPGVTQMAPATAVAFILLGLALCMIGAKPRGLVNPVESFVLLPMLISMLVLIGYAYRINPLISVTSTIPVSFPSAVLLMALSIGILCVHPERGLMSLVTRDSGSGRLVRQLLAGSIATLCLLGWLRLTGERLGFYGSELGFALFMLVNIVIFGVLIFRNALQLAEAECERAGMDAALRRAQEELEHRVEERTRDLASVVSELGSGFTMLMEVANNIMAASSQVSVGATETATAVAQTASTVEQVRQTARLTSQDSGQVAASALQAARTSQEGRRSTDEAIAIMQRIRQEMDAIAGSMVRLNDQTQAIGQIIATVNALAAQSNLLAVNAAIEAARAGERGKGFAVVAQEVKVLADQSRRATRQIGMILNDIQKATHQSVMAMEHGRKAVEMGVEQSLQTGHSIEELASSVSAAAEAATHIANTSQQQLIGVDQVAVAMSSIRQATMHSLDSARQMEAAAQHLKQLGTKLQQLAVHYKVAGS